MKNKLTDEEIVKALDICYNFKGCTNECPYFNKNGRNFCMEDKAFYKDLKDLINRLQAENKGLEDLCNKTYDDLTKEIERLTKERDMYANDLYWKAEVRKREDFITELTVENAELQQQVDELTDKLGKVLSGIKADKLLAARGTVRAVQDTADRIFRQVLKLYQGLSKAERETMTFEWKLLDLAVEYGVEVINERKETD